VGAGRVEAGVAVVDVGGNVAPPTT